VFLPMFPSESHDPESVQAKELSEQGGSTSTLPDFLPDETKQAIRDAQARAKDYEKRAAQSLPPDVQKIVDRALARAGG
jgi:hypothetical protein